MKCASCNTPLNGSTVCPSCGALNMAFGAAPVPSPQMSQELPVIEGMPAVSNGPVIEDGPAMQMPVNQTGGIVIEDGDDVVGTSTEVLIEDEPEILEIPDEDATPLISAVAEEGPIEYIQTPMPTQVVEQPVVETTQVVETAQVVEMPQVVEQPVISEALIQEVVVEPQEASLETSAATLAMIPEVGAEEEDIRVTSTMAPPTLQIEDAVSLTAGVGSINNNDVSTYSPEEMAQQNQEEVVQKRRDEDSVNFQIPSVQQPVQEVDSEVMAGGVPDIAVGQPTAGDGDGIVEGNESTNVVEDTEASKQKKGKFNLPTLNLKEIKRTKSLPLPFVIIGAVVVLVLGLVLGSSFATPTYTGGSYNKSNINTEKLPRVADGKNNITKAGAYTYLIPKSYYYDNVDGGVAIYNEEDTFRIYIRSDVGIYDDLATAKTSVIKTLEEQKVTINDYKETNINKKPYVVVQGSTKTINRMIAFTDAGNDYIFYVEIVTKDNIFNNDLLSIADDIIRGTKFNEKQAEMELIDVYDVSEVVIKASQEYKKYNK